MPYGPGHVLDSSAERAHHFALDSGIQSRIPASIDRKLSPLRPTTLLLRVTKYRPASLVTVHKLSIVLRGASTGMLYHLI